MTDVDDFLAHYGKKGMKWGQRKAAIATALDLPGHRRNPSPEQKKKDRIQFVSIVGGAAVIAGAAWVAKQRWNI